jgi:hypothetical protein
MLSCVSDYGYLSSWNLVGEFDDLNGALVDVGRAAYEYLETSESPIHPEDCLWMVASTLYTSGVFRRLMDRKTLPGDRILRRPFAEAVARILLDEEWSAISSSTRTKAMHSVSIQLIRRLAEGGARDLVARLESLNSVANDKPFAKPGTMHETFVHLFVRHAARSNVLTH